MADPDFRWLVAGPGMTAANQAANQALTREQLLAKLAAAEAREIAADVLFERTQDANN